MIDVHIAGTTGSGKSYIGDIIKRIYSKVCVVDLDHLINKLVRENMKNVERIDVIRKKALEFIALQRKKCKFILFVGYSDFIINNEVHHIDIKAKYNYFIDIPFDNLVKQYRHRASNYVWHTTDHVETLSNNELKNIMKQDQKIYAKFVKLPQMTILKELILTFGK